MLFVFLFGEEKFRFVMGELIRVQKFIVFCCLLVKKLVQKCGQYCGSDKGCQTHGYWYGLRY
jgi:flagellar biogenesis protein FliO